MALHHSTKLNKFEEESLPLFPVDADTLLGKAKVPLTKLAKISEASIKDIEVARKLIDEAKLETAETKALCDLITAQPVSDDLSLRNFNFHDWEKQKKKIQKSKFLQLQVKSFILYLQCIFQLLFQKFFR